ncbi:IclR family transcriptional regulator [Georgenia sp. Z1491]|uniref:IclR family transcriptional regulator n=1 Tax=Georgenia sp. Z1491 TaxID=3416707 RepID=UPI003CF7D50B
MATDKNRPVQGSQTLARGLSALQLISDSPDGLTGAEVARALDVHQSIAYRVLQTLVQYQIVRRDLDGRHRVGLSVLRLAQSARSGFRSLLLSTLKHLSEATTSTVALYVEENDEAVAALVVEPGTFAYVNRLGEGSRHPLDRGASGYALLSLRQPHPDEPTKVTEARDQGYALTHAEVQHGFWALAAPLDPTLVAARVCLNISSPNEDAIRAAVPLLLQAVQDIKDLVERRPDPAGS